MSLYRKDADYWARRRSEGSMFAAAVVVGAAIGALLCLALVKVMH